jgi:recombination DNA repair RAD52 pathway protein
MGGITPKTKSLLTAKLDPDHVRPPKQYGPKGDYIEAWHAIAEANRIFGFDSWDRETIYANCVMERERKIGKDQKPGWGVTYTAKVRVTVRFGSVVATREGTGSGHGVDVDPGQAHESAIKEAESDAMKRSLMTFGNPFGLALYDKSRASVGKDDGRMSKTKAREVAGKINDDLAAALSVEQIDEVWAVIQEEYIGKLPEDWEPALVQKYETERENLKEQEA